MAVAAPVAAVVVHAQVGRRVGLGRGLGVGPGGGGGEGQEGQEDPVQRLQRNKRMDVGESVSI